MGKFPCHCGNAILDSSYPCESSGTLRWEDEFEQCDRESTIKVAEFLSAIKNGNRDEWIANYFHPRYPSDLQDHEIVSDNYSKAFNERGHGVYHCPNCERIYVQREFYLMTGLTMKNVAND